MDFVDTMVHKLQYIDTQFSTRNQKSPNTFYARKISAEEIVFGILVNNSTKKPPTVLQIIVNSIKCFHD